MKKYTKIKKDYEGLGIRPIDTTCNCENPVRMIWNGIYHSVDCKCGRNVRLKGSNMIIDFSQHISLTTPKQ
jgi:hypothetical protein